jgi:hypothetical protein
MPPRAQAHDRAPHFRDQLIGGFGHELRRCPSSASFGRLDGRSTARFFLWSNRLSFHFVVLPFLLTGSAKLVFPVSPVLGPSPERKMPKRKRPTGKRPNRKRGPQGRVAYLDGVVS